MKKCDWCGQEYPDSAEQCTVDGRTLALPAEQSSTQAEPPVFLTQIVENLPPSAVIPPAATPICGAERRLRLFELLLVCVAAFGGSILHSASIFFAANDRSAQVGVLNWIHSGMLEATSLALVWYILLRRSLSFRQLGMTWRKTDLGWSVLVWMAGNLAFWAVYNAIYYSGYAASTESDASQRVVQMLFGSGVSLFTIAFAFFNPFFEELIVRAYVMTEVRGLTGSMPAAVAFSTLLQTSYHFYQGAPLALAEGAMFLVFSLFYARTNRITPVILAHLYLDLLPTLQTWLTQK